MKKLSFLAGVASTFAFCYVVCEIIGKRNPEFLHETIDYYTD